MALEIHLHQQKLDLTASLHADDKPHDLLLTSRGDGDSSTVNREDMVKKSFHMKISTSFCSISRRNR